MRKFSRKQIGAVGLAVLMSAQGPVMAAEVSQEETTSAIEVQTRKTMLLLTENSRRINRRNYRAAGRKRKHGRNNN